VFARQLSTPGRDKVWLNMEHEPGFGGAVGQSLQFRDETDGLHGSFGVDIGPDGDKALRLVNSGFLSGISLEFRALASKRVDGVVQRLRAQLDKVSLCRYPAYAGAEVLALREEAEGTTELVVDAQADAVADPPVEPVEPVNLTRNQEVDELLASVGVELLTRMSTTSAAWDGSPSRFTDEQYKRSALLCRGQSDSPKTDCSLPVLEPGGALNVNALGAAASALAGGRGGLANVTPALKAAAARKLIRYYNAAGMDPPESLRRLARA
jgi:HK97 family phage prohead protease